MTETSGSGFSYYGFNKNMFQHSISETGNTGISSSSGVSRNLNQPDINSSIEPNPANENPEPSFMTVTQKSDFLKEVNFFSNLSLSDLNDLAAISNAVTVHAGQIIIAQNSVQSNLYIITKGRVSIETEFPNAEGSIVKSILGHKNKKEFFGEISFITETPATASIIADETCNFLILSKNDFDKLILQKPVMGFRFIFDFLSSISIRISNLPDSMEEYLLWKSTYIQTDMSGQSAASMDVFQNIPLFKGFTQDELQKLTKITKVNNYFNGDFVFKNNESVTFLPIVNRGKFKVIKKNLEGQYVEIADKNCGELFCALHFFAGRPMEQTIKASMNSALFQLPEKEFGDLLLSNPVIGFKITRNLIDIFSSIMENIPRVYKNFVLWGYNPFETKVSTQITQGAAKTSMFIKFLALFMLIAGLAGGWFISDQDFFKNKVTSQILKYSNTKNLSQGETKKQKDQETLMIRSAASILLGSSLFLFIFVLNKIIISITFKPMIDGDRTCENCGFFQWILPGQFGCHKMNKALKTKDQELYKQCLPGETMSTPTACPSFNYVKIQMLRKDHSI
jgi:CRP-like cAMP-binding protein